MVPGFASVGAVTPAGLGPRKLHAPAVTTGLAITGPVIEPWWIVMTVPLGAVLVPEMRHSGTEWGHVLSGELTLTLGFDQYVLNPGDSVSFDCSTPHSYANHGAEPAVGVWFVAERFR